MVRSIRSVVVLPGTPGADLLMGRLYEAGIYVYRSGSPAEAATFMAEHGGSLACSPWDRSGIELITACRKQGICEPVVLLVTAEDAVAERLIPGQLSRIESARQAGALGALPSSCLGHPYIASVLHALVVMTRQPGIAQGRLPETHALVTPNGFECACRLRHIAGDDQWARLGQCLGELDALPHGRRVLALSVYMANGHPETADPVIGAINDLAMLGVLDWYVEQGAKASGTAA